MVSIVRCGYDFFYLFLLIVQLFKTENQFDWKLPTTIHIGCKLFQLKCNKRIVVRFLHVFYIAVHGDWEIGHCGVSGTTGRLFEGSDCYVNCEGICLHNVSNPEKVLKDWYVDCRVG